MKRWYKSPRKKAIGEPGSLIAHLPLYYTKAARENLGNLICSDSCIQAVAKGQRNNPVVREALAWVALEKLLTAIFNK